MTFGLNSRSTGMWPSNLACILSGIGWRVWLGVGVLFYIQTCKHTCCHRVLYECCVVIRCRYSCWYYTHAVLWRCGWRWNRFRTLCDSNKKIGLVLELTTDLPSDQEIERWTGEPVKALVVPTRVFITNKKGFPVLSRAHQNVIRMFLKVELIGVFCAVIWWVVSL